MNNTLLMPIMDDNIIMVQVEFRNHSNNNTVAWSRPYTYKASKDQGLVPGHMAVVEAKDHYQVVRIMNVDVAIPMDNDTMQYRWVVANLSSQLNSLDKMLAAEHSLSSQLDRKRAEFARAQALEALGIGEMGAKAMLMAAKTTG